MGLFDIFGGKKKKEAEKLEYINKLEPYKEQIGNFESIKTTLLELDIEGVKEEVDRNISLIKCVNYLGEKYGEELQDKFMTEGIHLGISEEQFNDICTYKVLNNKLVNDYASNRPYHFRKEEVLKTKTKVTRTNSKKRNPHKVTYIFEDDVLTKIQTSY